MTQGFAISDNDYIAFRDLIKERTGMLISDTRRDVLTRVLRENVKSLQHHDLDRYLGCLQAARTDSELWDELIRKLTINETYFFRHPEQIEVLRKNILPDLVARHWADHSLYIWSAGCATGEEPYTVAILLRQLLPDINKWRILILATDINRQALKVAEAGQYREWSFRDTDPAFRETYFKKKKDRYCLDPEICKMVTFSYLNLAEDRYPSLTNHTSHLDMIICRNVSIYLPQNITGHIIGRFYRCLSTGGWLMLGPSDTHLDIHKKFKVLIFKRTVVYQKMGLPISDTKHTDIQKKNVSVSSVSQKMPSAVISPVIEPKHSKESHEISKVQGHESSVPEQNIDLLKLGESQARQGRYNDAFDSFMEHLKKNPDSVEAKYRLACLEANLGRLDEARKWAEKALQDDPLRSEAYYIIAITYQSQDNIDEAIVWLKKAIYLDPDFILAHLTISHLYERKNMMDEAERHRSMAIYLAARLLPDTILPGSDGLTAGQIVKMARTV